MFHLELYHAMNKLHKKMDTIESRKLRNIARAIDFRR